LAKTKAKNARNRTRTVTGEDLAAGEATSTSVELGFEVATEEEPDPEVAEELAEEAEEADAELPDVPELRKVTVRLETL